MTHGFRPFAFTLTTHEATLATAVISAPKFIVGILAYVAAPVILGILATHPRRTAIGNTLWPPEAERRILVVALASTPLLLAVLAALLLREAIVSLWSMSAMTLLPAVLLSPPLVTVTRKAVVRMLALAIGFPLVMVAVSPVVAIVIHREGLSDYETHYRLIARAVQHAWQARTTAPLSIVGSYRNVVDGTAFYFPSRPSTFAITDPGRTPWSTKPHWARKRARNCVSRTGNRLRSANECLCDTLSRHSRGGHLGPTIFRYFRHAGAVRDSDYSTAPTLIFLH